MYGCRYCKMDGSHNEYCTITKEPTKGAVLCDFEWEDCPHYKEARKPIKPAREPKRSATPQLTQTSLFGAAGEKPFRE